MDTVRTESVSASVSQPSEEPKPASTAKRDRAVVRFDHQQRLQGKVDVLRNEVINAKARLALALRLPEQQPAPAVDWLNEAEDLSLYLTAIQDALTQVTGNIVLSSCAEFPCIVGVSGAGEGLFDEVATAAGGGVFLRRVGIEDDGETVQYVAISSSTAKELETDLEALTTRIEYRALLLDTAFREEQSR